MSVQDSIDRGDIFVDNEVDEADEVETPTTVETPETEAPEVETPEVETPETETPEVETPRDEKGKFTGKGIPKERFDQAVGKERAAREAAEQRVAALEAQIGQRKEQAAQVDQIDTIEQQIAELEAKHTSYLLDGDQEKASAVMRQIRIAEREIIRAEMRQESRTATAQTLESERVELSIAKLEADHPVLNPDSEEYNEALTNFVLAEQQRLMRTETLSPSRALNKAALSIIEKFGPKSAPEDAAPKGLSKVQGERKAAAVEKNLAVKQSQPAALRNVGLDSDKAGQIALPDIRKMSPEEYAALPASTRSRLRGDTL